MIEAKQPRNAKHEIVHLNSSSRGYVQEYMYTHIDMYS